ESDGSRPALAPQHQETEGHDSTREHAEQQGQEPELPAEKGAEHGAELHVAATHAAATGEDDDKEDPAADDDPEEGLEPRDPTGEQIRHHAGHDAGQRDDVRNDLVGEIDG